MSDTLALSASVRVANVATLNTTLKSLNDEAAGLGSFSYVHMSVVILVVLTGGIQDRVRFVFANHFYEDTKATLDNVIDQFTASITAVEDASTYTVIDEITGLVTFSFTRLTCIVGVEWDSINTPATMNQNSTESISVTGGEGPYNWAIEGTGVTLGSAQTVTGNNTVIADGTACGSAAVSVSDACGGSTACAIRLIQNSGWSATDIHTCVIEGDPTEVDGLSRIECQYKMKQQFYNYWSESSGKATEAACIAAYDAASPPASCVDTGDGNCDGEATIKCTQCLNTLSADWDTGTFPGPLRAEEAKCTWNGSLWIYAVRWVCTQNNFLVETWECL